MDTSSQIKVIHLINGLGVGGAETMLLKLISGMDRKQFSNIVITLTDGGGLLPRLKALNVPTHSLGMRRGRPTVGGFLRLLRILRKVQPQVVQTWLYHADLLGFVAGRLMRVPRCVWNIRVSDLEIRKYPRISRWVLGACVRLSRWPDLVLVNSAAAQTFHTTLGYRPKAWQIIPNGFDTKKFRPDPAARHVFRDSIGRSDNFLIGLVARYDPMKDHATFLKAVQQFRRTRSDSHFLLAGTGVDTANPTLMEMTEALGVRDAVTLLGERHDMQAVLPALDVLTLSSAFGEGFSNAIGEGMACAVPCVVTDVGDMADVVGHTGLVVPPADPTRLAAAWNELYEMGPDARKGLGSLARHRIEDSFSLTGVVSEYERTYSELLHSTARA